MERKCLICFDVDSTLIDGEPLDDMAEEAGVGSEVKNITESAMRGEMEFEEAVRKRLMLLQGFPVSRLEEIVDGIPLMNGAEQLIRTLKERGFVTGTISGGFSIAVERVAEKLGLDFFIANTLEVKDGRLTGGFDLKVNGNKHELLRKAAEEFHVEKTFAVGDGANDIAMLKAADVGIAFCAKASVNKTASCIISEKNLMKVADFVGDCNATG